MLQILKDNSVDRKSLQNSLNQLQEIISKVNVSLFSAESQSKIAKNIVEWVEQLPKYKNDIVAKSDPILFEVVKSKLLNSKMTNAFRIPNALKIDTIKNLLEHIYEIQNIEFKSQLVPFMEEHMFRLFENSQDVTNYAVRLVELLESSKDIVLSKYLSIWAPLCSGRMAELRVNNLISKYKKHILQNIIFTITEDYIESVKFIASSELDHREKIWNPIRNYYDAEIKKNQFGAQNYYKTIVFYDERLAITPHDERSQYAQNVYTKLQAQFEANPNPDLESFLEKVSQDIKLNQKYKCSNALGSDHLKEIKNYFNY